METFKQRLYTLLRKSERIFKTDMVYLARGGFWLGLNQVAVAGIVFLGSIVFANLVSKEVYGNYKFVMTVASMLGSLSLTGLGIVVTQGVARGGEGILKSSITSSIRWSWILVTAAVATAGYYLLHGNAVLATSILISGIGLSIANSYGLYGSYLVGKKDFRSVAIYNVASQLLTTAGVVMTVLVTHSVLATVLAYFAINALTTYLSYVRVSNTFHINETTDERLMPYSKHLSVMNFFSVIANQLDKVLVFHYLGAASLATYAFSQAIPDQAKGVFKNIFGIAVPKYASLSEDDLRQSIIKKTIQLTLVAVIITGLYIALAPIVFKLLFPKYMEAVLYSQIYMVGLVTIPGISLFAMYFQLKHEARTLYKINIASNVVTVVLGYVLIYNFGIMGAVLENGLSWIIMLVIHWYYFAADTPSRGTAPVPESDTPHQS